jgi:hypothetical protein
MPAVLIKDFPKDLHQEMKLQAVLQETTLKDLILRYCQEGLERDKKRKKKGR